MGAILVKRILKTSCKGMVLFCSLQFYAYLTQFHCHDGTDALVICNLNRKIHYCWENYPQVDS
ncbi:hypothetical protein Gotur_032983 [Gossypium turneri]